jgi:TP901 family phage tail tape measure protein
MAINMEALLKLRAQVDGGGQIDGLSGKLKGLKGAAATARGGLTQMASGASSLLSPIRALVPAVSAVGLVSMAKNALDNADALSKMAQRTGASVESLSKFQKAAELSDSSIEGVGKGLVQLSKSMVAAQNGTGAQAEAFNQLGISLKNADGSLRSTDEVMLDLAEKFKTMPDGPEKTAAAMKLLGKSGADLIPMLNMGREGIEKLGGSMTTEFAQRAAAFNDKITEMGQKFGELGIKLGEGLLPALESLANSLLGLIDAFSALPAPVQIALIAIVAFGPQIVALIKIFGGLIAVVKSVAIAIGAGNIGGLIAGWLPVVVKAIAGIVAAVKGVAATILAIVTGPVGITVLILAAVVALVVAFRKPIGDFFNWLGGAIMDGIKVIWKAGEPIRNFWSGVWENAKKLTTDFIKWIGDAWQSIGRLFQDYVVKPLGNGLNALYALAYQVLVQPWINLWNAVLREPVSKMGEWFKGIWTGIVDFFNANVIKPITSGWNAMVQLLPKAMKGALDFVQNAWNSMVNGIKGAIRNVLQFIASNLNSIGAQVNRLIGAFNRLPGPDIPLVPTLTVPAFAKGGYVGGGTLALVGEAGPEYIIPERKMAQASMNYLNGARGGAVIPAYAQGGYVGGNAQINVTTGPVMQQGGQQYVSMADFERGLQEVASSVYQGLRRPSTRTALGLS